MTSPATPFDWSDDHYSAYGTRPLCSPHSLSDLPMFTKDALIELLDRFPRNELQAFTMGDDPCDPSDWSCVNVGDCDGEQLWRAVERGRLWLNLLWIDVSEPAYKDLLTRMYGQLAERVERLQSYQNPHMTLLISSPGAQVYYHFDAEDNMLWHLRGEKTIWLWPNSQRDKAPQSVVEDIFARTASEELPFHREYEADAERFDLTPGMVVSWPHNAPHRVENKDSVNVSISTSVETRLSERRRMIYCSNRMLRKFAGNRQFSTDELGMLPASKRLALRVARRSGMFPDPPHPVYKTRFQIDPEAENGMRILPAPVHTAFCSTQKA